MNKNFSKNFITNYEIVGNNIVKLFLNYTGKSDDICFTYELYLNNNRIYTNKYSKQKEYEILINQSANVSVKAYILDRRSKVRTSKLIKIGKIFCKSKFYEDHDKEFINENNFKKGDLFLNQDILVFNDIFPPYFFEKLSWNLDPYKNRTWRWLFLQFTFLNYIISYCDYNKDIADNQKHYVFGLELLLNFYEYSLIHPEDRELLHDHGTALRLKNMCHYWFYGLINGYIQYDDDISLTTFDIIKYHINLLIDENFYSQYTNHGFDQSLILYQVCSELKDLDDFKQPIRLATDRIIDEITFVFNADGGHKENSPGYLNFGIKQLISAFDIETCYEVNHPKLFLSNKKIFNHAANALLFSIKPDGSLPLIGDTSLSYASNIFGEYRPNCYQEYLYSIRKGKAGVIPNEKFLVLPDTGYIVARTWNKTPFSHNFFLMFKSGYLSNYHRHDDDLSFVLYNMGEDWLIDGGIYKYDNRDPHRKYIRSSMSHNIITPNKAIVNRTAPDANISKILSYSVVDNEISFEAMTKMFIGYLYTRQMNINPINQTIFIQDSIVIEDSNPTKTDGFVSRFLVPNDKDVNIVNENTIEIKGKKSFMSITMKSGLSFELRLRQEPKKNIVGWLSKEVNKLYQNKLIEIEFENGSNLSVDYFIKFK